MPFADPQSFDTLEKAQAEIARRNAIFDRFLASIEPILADMAQARADIARLLDAEKV